MGTSVHNYAADRVTVTVGATLISGFADGTFISVSRDEQAYNAVTGADGFVSRAKTGNRAGTITLTLQQTSPSNDILSGFMIADELRNRGVFPIFIQDQEGETIFQAQHCWVQQMPDSDFSKEISNRVWTLACARINAFVGGNNTA